LVTHDPIGTGLVASLARPGGNVTGLSAQAADTAGKRLELLRKALWDSSASKSPENHGKTASGARSAGACYWDSLLCEAACRRPNAETRAREYLVIRVAQFRSKVFPKKLVEMAVLPPCSKRSGRS
jgi:hypothetical protein